MTRKRFTKLIMGENPPQSRNYANFVAEFVRLGYRSYKEGFEDMLVFGGSFEEYMYKKEQTLDILRNAKFTAKKLRTAFIEYNNNYINID